MDISARRYFNQAKRAARNGLNTFVRRPYVLASVSGVLLLLAQYVPGIWFLAFVALVPFIHALRSGKGNVNAIFVAGIFGILLIGGTTSATLLADIGLPGAIVSPLVERLLVIISWGVFFLPLVPTVIVFALIARRLPSLGYGEIAGLTVVWVLLELSRMFIFNIATFSPGVGNPPFFSASFLGYVLADSESFLQGAAIGGVSFLSALVIGVNLFVYRALTKQQKTRRRLLAGMAVTLGIITLLPIADIRERMQPASEYAVVDIGIMAVYGDGEGSYHERINELTTRLLEKEPNLIVLPEGADVKAVPPQNPSAGTQVLGSRVSSFAGRDVVVAEVGLAGSEERKIIGGKSVLAAQGEYVIGLFSWTAGATLLGDELHRLRGYGNLSALTWGEGFSIGEKGVRVSGAFCVEMLRPYLGAELVQTQATGLIAFMLSHQQFNNAYTLRIDTPRFLKVRAVEAEVPLVASAQSTKAYALDAYGRTIAELGHDGDALEVVKITALVHR